MKFIEVTYVDDDDHDIVVDLPAHYEVCSRCDGEGTHVNPSVDGNGITASEWAEWDDESRETYMNGGYDVQCYECHGERVVLVIDEDAIEQHGTDKQRKALDEYREQRSSDAAEHREQRYWARMEECGP